MTVFLPSNRETGIPDSFLGEIKKSGTFLLNQSTGKMYGKKLANFFNVR